MLACEEGAIEFMKADPSAAKNAELPQFDPNPNPRRSKKALKRLEAAAAAAMSQSMGTPSPPPTSVSVVERSTSAIAPSQNVSLSAELSKSIETIEKTCKEWKGGSVKIAWFFTSDNRQTGE